MCEEVHEREHLNWSVVYSLVAATRSN